jgi:hypothetical protein
LEHQRHVGAAPCRLFRKMPIVTDNVQSLSHI